MFRVEMQIQSRFRSGQLSGTESGIKAVSQWVGQLASAIPAMVSSLLVTKGLKDYFCLQILQNE
jgi:hypothetical protein